MELNFLRSLRFIATINCMEIPLDLKKDIEVGFLKIIFRSIQLNEMKLLDAKNLAKAFLPTVKSTSFEEFRLQVTSFIESHQEFKELTLVLEKYDSEKETNAVLEKMRKHMTDGALDKAVSVAAEYTQT